jgi:hypothetical protein
MVAAALGLLTSGSDVARKNSALFLDHALATRAICHEFDLQEGLHRLLFPLRRLMAMAREDGNPDVRTERQVAYHSARALLQYGRAHLMLQLEALRRRLASRQVGGWGVGVVLDCVAFVAAVCAAVRALCG